MRTLLSYLIIALSIGIQSYFSVFAQEIAETNTPSFVDVCANYKLQIIGSSDIKKNITTRIAINVQSITNGSGNMMEVVQPTTFTVFYKGQISNTVNDQEGELYYAFPELGIYEIKAETVFNDCPITDTKLFRVYNNIEFYIGSYITDYSYGLLDNIQENDTLFATTTIDANIKSIDSISEQLIKNAGLIAQSDTIFFNITNFSLIFDILGFLDAQKYDITQKKLIVISNTDSTLVKKFLASFIYASQRQNIYLMDEQGLTDYLFNLSIGKLDTNIDDYTTLVNYDEQGNRFSFSRLVDLLIYYGVNFSLIGLMFSLVIAVCILVFIKQVIGLPGYGLYYPLFTALCIHIVGPYTVLTFLLFARLAHMSTSRFFSKFNFLFYAKIGLYLMTYTLVTIVLVGTYAHYYGSQISLVGMNESMFLLCYYLIALCGKKVFTETKSIFRIKWRLHLVWFCSLSYFLSIILTHKPLQYFFLINNRYIFFLIFALIMLGRFSGLQITEYIRFWPLIWKSLKQTIEKKVS